MDDWDLDLLGRDVFEILEIDGEKYINFWGYGYHLDEEQEKDYRILEYCWFEVPLRDVIARGFYDYESEWASKYKQIITDVTYEELVDTYKHWNNGNPPEKLDVLNMNTPVGVYIC